MAEDKPKGYLAKYGGRLIDKGYEIIPIRRGSKAPPFDDWQKVRATHKLFQSWINGDYSRAGVGILTRKTPAVDLDIPDEKIALQMQAFVEENFGFAPIRVGFAPKRLLVFRTDEPFPKINSSRWLDEWDTELDSKGKPRVRKVEILGDGQQFVAYHVHPDTLKPYEWISNGSPAKVAAADLPILTQADGQRIVDEFERLAVAAGWEKVKAPSLARLTGGVKGKIAHDDVFAADKAKTEIGDDELHKKLLMVPGAEDYETWLQIGMALWHQYDGEQAGLDLWHEWSETATNYDPGALEDKWETFDVSDKGRTPVTARLIIKLADEAAREIAVETFRDIRAELAAATSLESLRATCEKVKHIEFDVLARSQLVGMVKDRFKAITGQLLVMGLARDMLRYENPEPKELPRWLEGWVYVTTDKSFYSRVHRYAMSTEAFNAAFGRHMLTKRDVVEGKSNPETLPSAFALNNKQIPIVYNRMYLPGEEDLFRYNGLLFVNSYSDNLVPEVPAKLRSEEAEAVETVKAHLKNLFHNVRDRAVLLDALAFIVQNPGKRLNWAILLQGVEGDGKTFFHGLLAAALGPDNVVNLNAQAMEEKYNAWSEGYQLVFFEEIKLHGHNRFDVLNKVKPLITNTMVSVRRMNTDTYPVVNTATYILTTNFRDALPLDDNDSRYFILFSRYQTKEALRRFEDANPGYFDRLYGSLVHGGALRKWLLGHKINPTFSADKRAPMSEAKNEMVRYAETDEAAALKEILATSMRPDMTTQLLNATDLADEMVMLGADAPYGKAMNALLLRAGFSKLGKIRIGDKTPLFWSQIPGHFTTPDGVIDQAAVKKWVADEL